MSPLDLIKEELELLKSEILNARTVYRRKIILQLSIILEKIDCLKKGEKNEQTNA